MTTDLTYTTHGFFTTLYPASPAGQVAWKEINDQSPGGKIYTAHLDKLLADLRAAGYCVRKQKTTKANDEELLAELFG